MDSCWVHVNLCIASLVISTEYDLGRAVEQLVGVPQAKVNSEVEILQVMQI